MRPFEILLSFTNILTLCVLALPLSQDMLWMRSLAPITLLIAIVHILAEGPRWQMVPAYMLTGLFLLAWLVEKVAVLQGSSGQFLNSQPALGLILAFAIFGLTVSIILPVILPVFRFPHPGGPYEIGTLTYHWVDASRPEVFSTDPDARRELMVQIWYPAQKGSSNPRAPYIQDSAKVASALTILHNFPNYSLNHLKYVTTNAMESAVVADDKPNYPVLIFLEGLTGYRQMNTFQVEELVSHGYIVMGIDQPGAAATVIFPDGHQISGLAKNGMEPLTQQSINPVENAPVLNGRSFKEGIIPYFAGDVSFALDQLVLVSGSDKLLRGKLDLERVGVFGVSFGGIVGAEACLRDPRLKACLVMDVFMPADVVQQGLQQPGMWITRPADTMRLERQKAGGWTEQDIEQHQTSMLATYDRSHGNGYFVQVPGMFHIDMTDITYISPIFPLIGFSGPIGSQRAHEIVNAYTLAFFERHLQNKAETLLDGAAKQYPEVIFETRRP